MIRIDPDAVLPAGSNGHAGAYLVCDDEGRVLLQERRDNLPDGFDSRWATPGGAWEDGETPRETAHREAEEETSLRLSQLRYFATFPFGTGAHGSEVSWHVFFSFESLDGQAIEVREGLDFRFFSKEEIAALGPRLDAREGEVLSAFLASDQYRGSLAPRRPHSAATVIELDRWGRVLLQLRDRDLPPHLFPGTWTLPGGAIEEGESPDAAALREFEEETGQLLDEINFFRAYPMAEVPGQVALVQHVFFIDADLDADLLDCREGLGLRYFSPDELESVEVAGWTAPVLAEFFSSGAYKGLFH